MALILGASHRRPIPVPLTRPPTASRYGWTAVAVVLVVCMALAALVWFQSAAAGQAVQPAVPRPHVATNAPTVPTVTATPAAAGAVPYVAITITSERHPR